MGHPSQPFDRVSNVNEFLGCLIDLRRWSGQPSLRRLQQLAGTTEIANGCVIDALPRSTVSAVLRGDRLPRADFVEHFVRACLRARHVDAAEIESFTEATLTAWVRLADDNDALPEPLQGGAAEPSSVPPTPTVPHHLPGNVANLCGRVTELRRLNDFTDAPTAAGRSVVVCGMPGVGKTALALHWAQSRAECFPDGQLFADLGSSRGQAMTYGDVLAVLLSELCVRRDALPDDPVSRLALYRSGMFGRSMLLVLDDVADPGQVRPLLPPGGRCLTIITSRNRLSGMVARDGARRISLGPASPEAARAILYSASNLPQSPAVDRAFDEIAQLCAHLPLALRIVGVNLADRPERTVHEYTARLRTGDRLPTLALDLETDEDLGQAFEGSFRRLDGATRAVFCRTAQLRDPVFDVSMAARVAQVNEAVAGEGLARLAAESLIEPRGCERFEFNHLIRDFARRRGLASLSAAGREHRRQLPPYGDEGFDLEDAAGG